MKWTKEKIQIEANKYKYKKDFRKESRGAYEAAVRLKYIPNCCSHMIEIKTKWSNEKALKEALKYKTKEDFAKQSNGAYSYILNNELKNEAFMHMQDPRIIWTNKTITEEALKYKYPNDFKLYSNGAYQAAHKLNIFKQISQHMNKKNKEYSKNELILEAKKYLFRGEFKKQSYGAYQSAYRKNILDEICTHMKISNNRFNLLKPSILYYFKIDNVWKIGITNYTLEDRYYKRDRDKMKNIMIWKYQTGAEAKMIETEVLKNFKQYQYNGQTPFTDGTQSTECFTHDIYNIDVGISWRMCDKNGNPME